MNRQMSVKEFLEQALNINKMVELKKRQIAELEDINKRLSSEGLTKLSAGKAADAEGYSATAMSKLWESYVKEITRLLLLKYEIGERIAEVADENCRMVLEARYVSCMKWENIAEMMYFSLMHVHRLAREGIAMLEKL